MPPRRSRGQCIIVVVHRTGRRARIALVGASRARAGRADVVIGQHRNRSVLCRDPDDNLINVFTPLSADAIKSFSA
jgi:hypothetical protein